MVQDKLRIFFQREDNPNKFVIVQEIKLKFKNDGEDYYMSSENE